MRITLQRLRLIAPLACDDDPRVTVVLGSPTTVARVERVGEASFPDAFVPIRSAREMRVLAAQLNYIADEIERGPFATWEDVT